MNIEDKKILEETLKKITAYEERIERFKAMLETAEQIVDDGDYSVTIQSRKHTAMECELGIEGTRFLEGYLIPYLREGIKTLNREIQNIPFPEPVAERDINEEAA